MTKIRVRLKQFPYEVFIEPGLLERAGEFIARTVRGHVTIVTSPNVWRPWGSVLTRSLRAANIKHQVIDVADGESKKNLRTVEHLLRRFVSTGMDRQSTVVAFGGGVIGDTAAFAASIYMRGIPVVQIPTTLLAQVDAAIGGKTGVNLAEGKNLAGTFHQPRMVLIDPEVLSTLSARDFRAGLFEVIKCGVIRDPKLFASLEGKRSALECRHEEALTNAIVAAVRVKAEVVAADEKESDLRRILNFGHTIGHALEAESQYRRFLHGEAVGWGMIAAAEIGVNVGVTRITDAERIIDLVMNYGPLPTVKADLQRVMKLIATDKKSVNGIPHFVLAKRIGTTTVVGGIDPQLIRAAVKGINRA